MVTKRIRPAWNTALLAAVMLAAGCGDDSGSAVSPQPATGAVAPKFQLETATGSLDIGPYLHTLRFHLYDGRAYDTSAVVPYAEGSASFHGIPPGDVVVTIEGLDENGRALCRGSDTVTVIAGVSIEPLIHLVILVPFITAFTSHAEGDTVFVEAVTLRGIVKSASVLAYIQVNGHIVPSDAQGNWSYSAALTEGDNAFILVARDALGTTARDTLHIRYFDVTGPEVSILPPSQTISLVESVLVQVRASDPSGIAAVTVNGNPASEHDDVWTYWARLSGPATLLRIVAVDNSLAQNMTIDSIVILLDTEASDTVPPFIAITAPAADTVVYDTAAISVRGIATDAGSGVARVVVNGVEASYNAQTGQWSIVVSPAADTFVVRAFAEDHEGNISAYDSVRIIRDNTPQTPQWRRERIDAALAEGQTLMLSLADSCLNPAAASYYHFSIAGTHPYSEIRGGTYVFTAGVRSAGTHTDTLVVSALPPNDTLGDTMLVAITVSPVSYLLSVRSADTLGTVTPAVTDSLVRWGDTVTVTAAANTGYEFDRWLGDAGEAGATSPVLQVIMTGDKTLSATFRPSASCTVIQPTEDLNAVRQSAALGIRPIQLCPEEGDYLNGAAKVHITGSIRFTFN